MALKWLCSLLLLSAASCAEHQADAVTGFSCFERPEQTACARPTWPNELSHTNSDPWLDTHANGLREMRPRLLVLDFHNPLTLAELGKVIERQVEALAESSRYHGYKDPDAPVFLQYEVSKVVDLRDKVVPADWTHTSSTRVPLNSKNAFSVEALFEEPFTTLIGTEDPEQPGRMLGLCEQFERGLIHEVWISSGDNGAGREPPAMLECKVGRDENGQRNGAERVSTSFGDASCVRIPPCGVTVRVAHLSPLRGVGCDLYVRSWGIEGSVAAIPYMRRNAARFLKRDGTGCGTPAFPPNANFEADFQNTTKVETRCEHYGMRNADNGGDKPSTYGVDTIASLAEKFKDCGGGWQMYWRQNLPGLDNQAFAEDGTAMKNWWPFLFF